MGQQPPGAPGAQEVEDSVDDLALARLARAAAGTGVGDHRLDRRPLSVGQIGGIGNQRVDRAMGEREARGGGLVPGGFEAIRHAGLSVARRPVAHGEHPRGVPGGFKGP